MITGSLSGTSMSGSLSGTSEPAIVGRAIVGQAIIIGTVSASSGSIAGLSSIGGTITEAEG